MEMNEIQLGVYRHYKGGEYRVLGCAKHSETNEWLVVYQSLSDDGLWVRPKEMFLELVEINNEEVPRFEYISG
ncbi:MAG: DUF1653 domain-containing protein [Parcubacteria group bacterium]|nr:DUF1653 domain-containing protein [Parcubacteria group bacterium]